MAAIDHPMRFDNEVMFVSVHSHAYPSRVGN